MDCAHHAFLQPDSANEVQPLAEPEKIHRRRAAGSLAQPCQPFRAAVGVDELIQLAALNQRQTRCELAEDRGFSTSENLPCQIFYGRVLLS